jgi:HAE1 family hydrophobic/amphiphilic exporter-1
MDLIKLAIRQPVTVIVGVLLLLLAGLVSLSRLPIQLTPNVDSTIITVSTFWEGASPEEIEQNVIDKQEERLLGLSNLVEMTSESSQSLGRIRLEFTTGTDIKAARQEVSDKLREVPEYPDNVDEPVIAESDEETRDYIAWIVFWTTDPDFDIELTRDFAVDRIEPALENVPGISEIQVYGGREREVQIRVDPVALAQYGITPTQFANVIRDTNQNYSAGQIEDGKLDVRLRTISQYATLEEVENTVVKRGVDGGKVLVRDVATVEQTYKEPSSYVRWMGQPVLAIPAEREVGSNIMEVMNGLRARIDRLNAPGGLLDSHARRLGINGELKLRLIYDQTVYIDDALGLVQSNIWLGGGLATIVLLLFLRSIRSLVVIGVAIPISIIGAVVAMVAMGRSINVISLAGMAFAVGMVVDNAIVVLENVFRHVELGKSPMQAAYDGAKEVWGAVLASTLTTIMVFVPILLVQEEAGQLFRDISLAICAAVGLSLVVSITVIPCAAARILRNGKSNGERKQAHHAIADAVARTIHWLCGGWIVRPLIIIALTVASVVGTWLLIPPADYLPTGNRNLVLGMAMPPPGYNIQQMSVMGERIEKTIEPYWEAGKLIDDPEAFAEAKANLPSVPTFDWMTQMPGDPIVPPPLKNYFLVSFEGIIFQGAVSEDSRRVVDIMPLFTHAMRGEVLPGVIAFPFQLPLFQLGGATGSAVKMQLIGPELDEIVAAADVISGELFGNPKFGQVQPRPMNFNLDTPELQVRPNLVRLSELGLTTADVGLAIRANGDGAIIDEYHLAGEAIDLKVVSADAVDDPDLTTLADLPIATPTGHVVPLESFAEIHRTGTPQSIARVGRQRAVSFEVSPAEGVSLEEAVNELEALIERQRASGVIPDGVETKLAGSASKLAAVRSALLGDGTVIGTVTSSLALALLVVYLLMCVLFQSFVRPLVIMFSVPLAMLGGFMALFAVFIWTASDPYMPMQMLDVLTMLGFVILIGIVVNNAILIVHQTLNFLYGHADSDSKYGEDLTPRQAIAEAVRTRVRPIFMSALTSIGGMLPLVLMPGSGSELYRGLGSVVVGGLLISTIFTLLLVPLLLSLVFDLQLALGRLGRRGKQAVVSTSEAPARGAAPAPAK